MDTLDHSKSSTLKGNFFFFLNCDLWHGTPWSIKGIFLIQYNVCMVESLCHNVECLPFAFPKSNVLCDLHGYWRDIYGIRVSISNFVNQTHSIPS